MAFDTNYLDLETRCFVSSTGTWSVTNGTMSRSVGIGGWIKDWSSDEYGNSLQVVADGVGAASLTTGAWSVESGESFLGHIGTITLNSVPDETWCSVELVFEDGDSNELTPDEGAAITFAEITRRSADWWGWNTMTVVGTAPADAVTAYLRVEYSGASTGLAAPDAGDNFLIYDPGVVEVGEYMSDFLWSAYEGLPLIFREMDEEEGFAPANPMRKYLGLLSYHMSVATEDFKGFRKLDAEQTASGEAQIPELVDPVNMRADYIPWLASILGVELSSVGSSFTSWSAIETAYATWAALEAGSPTWADLQSLSGTEFDSSGLYRNQLVTKYNGIDGGRIDSMEAYLRTLLNTSDPDSAFLEINKHFRGDPFQIEVVVDSTVDPDPNGNLLQRAAQTAAPAGTGITVERGPSHYSIMRYDSTDIPPTAGEVLVGGGEMTLDYIVDSDGQGRNLVLQEPVQTTDKVWGAGIGPVPLVSGSGLLSGYRVGVTSASSSVLNLSTNEDFEIFVKLSRVAEPTAATGAGTNTSSEPVVPDGAASQASRILCSTEQWELRIGLDTGDLHAGLVYRGADADEWIASASAIPLVSMSETRPVWLRVRKEGENVEFFAQNDLWDDWSDHSYGTTPIAGGSANDALDVVTEPTLTILNHNDPGNDTFDQGLSCIVNHVMIFNDLWEPTVHDAYEYSGSVIDVNFNVVPYYAESFTESSGNDLLMTVHNDAGAAPNKAYGMRTRANGDPLWFFGQALGGASADQDSMQVTLGSAAVRDVKVRSVQTTGGTYDTINETTWTTGNTATPTVRGVTNSVEGLSIVSIELIPTGGTFSDDGTGDAVAWFTPDIMDDAGETGTDSFGNDWNITRSLVADQRYIPSQRIEYPPYVHTDDGELYTNNTPRIDIATDFTVVTVARRFDNVTSDGGNHLWHFERSDNIGGIPHIGLRYLSNGNDLMVHYKYDTATSGSAEVMDTTLDWTTGIWEMYVMRKEGETLTMDVMHRAIDHIEATGSFTIGETITGGTSGASAEVLTDSSGTMRIGEIKNGPFVVGEIITGATSTETAEISVYGFDADNAELDLSDVAPYEPMDRLVVSDPGDHPDHGIRFFGYYDDVLTDSFIALLGLELGL